MRLIPFLLGASLLVLTACASVGTPANDALAEALANPARSDSDRERDQRDLPGDVLKLAGFRPGMKVADVFGGGGYYSEIIAGIVGPKGHVRLIHNPPYAMNRGKGTLDGALIVMSYHDLYVADPADNWPAIDAGQFIDQIVAGLKPGGVLLIVDHHARAGTGKGDAQTLHRIEESFAVADFKAHGLDFAGSIDVLRNSNDDHSLNVFDKAIRGKTDRFVHLYRKPIRVPGE